MKFYQIFLMDWTLHKMNWNYQTDHSVDREVFHDGYLPAGLAGHCRYPGFAFDIRHLVFYIDSHTPEEEEEKNRSF